MKNYIYIIALILITSSCQKVIDLPVSDEEPKIVIDAKYDAILERVDVKISKTIDVFSAEDFPLISGAIVEIKDENGVITPLIDQGDGTYLLENYSPTYNSEYAMHVNIEGEIYEAKDSLMPVVPLDSLTTEFQPESPFNDEGYLVYMHISDPVGPNFYRAIRKENDEYQLELGDQFMFDDGLTEGNAQKIPVFANLYEVGDTIQFELLSYSEKTYNYFQELKAIAANSANSAAPANPTINWSKEALGHFSAFGYDTKVIIIEE